MLGQRVTESAQSPLWIGAFQGKPTSVQPRSPQEKSGDSSESVPALHDLAVSRGAIDRENRLPVAWPFNSAYSFAGLGTSAENFRSSAMRISPASSLKLVREM